MKPDAFRVCVNVEGTLFESFLRSVEFYEFY